MKLRASIKYFCGFILLLFVPCLLMAQERPNIVFILADDLGWADLPSYGNSFNEAPNLDVLARQGMRFTNAYAPSPVCSSSRAAIQSGQYPPRVGIIDFIPGHTRPFEEVIVPVNRTQFLPSNITSIAEALKTAGYKTGYFGKWHLGVETEHMPAAQGYDTSHVYVDGGFYKPNFQPEIKPAPLGRLSKILTDLSIDFIENNKDDPFFLFLSHYDVHVQLDADKDIIQKYLDKENNSTYPGNAIYAAMIEHVDISVGRVLMKLEELGLDGNTIVIFYSDNGGLISRFDKIPLVARNSIEFYKDSPLQYISTSNTPLRNEKGTVYEGGIREPLIVKWPNKIKAGSVSDALVNGIDFYPTLLELAGAEAPQNQILDGKSILQELLEDKYDPERAIYWHYPVYHHGFPAGAVRKGEWKLIENQITGDVFLYNLKANISETTDLKTVYPAKANELISLLKNWQKEVGAEFPVSNPNFDPSLRAKWGWDPKLDKE